jgi:hypothetical protein
MPTSADSSLGKRDDRVESVREFVTEKTAEVRWRRLQISRLTYLIAAAILFVCFTVLYSAGANASTRSTSVRKAV